MLLTPFCCCGNRAESSGEAGADPGEATEASDLYQNEEGENRRVIVRGHQRPTLR